MRNLLRKGLDKYEERQERRDDELGEFALSALNAISNRRTLNKFLFILGGANILIWTSVLLFPRDVYHAFGVVNDVSDRIGIIVLGLVFGLGLWITYSLLRIRFPDIEDQTSGSDVFASYAYHSHANKRWLVWLFSVIGGIFNMFGVIFVELLFAGN